MDTAMTADRGASPVAANMALIVLTVAHGSIQPPRHHQRLHPAFYAAILAAHLPAMDTAMTAAPVLSTHLLVPMVLIVQIVGLALGQHPLRRRHQHPLQPFRRACELLGCAPSPGQLQDFRELVLQCLLPRE